MKRLVLLAAAAIAAAVVAAVLSATGGGSAQAAVRHAATRTIDAGSSRFTITYSYTGAALSAFGSFPAPSQFTVRGAMDYRRHRGFLRYGGFGGLDEQIVFDGNVTYWKVGAPEGWFPKDKWLRVDSGQDDPFDPQSRALRDPATLLAFLRLTSSKVGKAGEETIEGVQTTRYDGTLDFQRIVDQAPAAERDDLQDELDFMRDVMPSTVSYSVWVDSKGVARRLRVEQTDSAALTIDFHDFGAPVDVTIPRADAILSDADFEKIIASHANTQDGSDCGGHSQSSDDGDDQVVVELCFTGTVEAKSP